MYCSFTVTVDCVSVSYPTWSIKKSTKSNNIFSCPVCRVLCPPCRPPRMRSPLPSVSSSRSSSSAPWPGGGSTAVVAALVRGWWYRSRPALVQSAPATLPLATLGTHQHTSHSELVTRKRKPSFKTPYQARCCCCEIAYRVCDSDSVLV